MILGVLLLGCTSCNILKPITANNYHRSDPPNGFRIEGNFYCDKTEIANLGYREYLYWIARVYGESYPEVYLEALPDTTVWLQLEDSCLALLSEVYLRHPAYDDHPVVGITQEQAKQYSKWRSDRVFEMYLVKLKRIAILPNPNEDNCFTIERYYSGELPNILPSKGPPVAYYPEFRLPNLEERQRILRYAD